MQFLFYTVLSTVFVSAHCSLSTEYYSKLINQKTSQANSYELPRTNEEFRKGVESKAIYDFGCYDFVIVGAGSAGSVLATRLSEISDFKILLLEAGGEEDDFNQIMGMLTYLQLSDMNWGYQTTKQNKSCLGMVDQKCNVPRGKAIGGSSAINAMMYVRGNPRDYDKWVELGNDGWSYEEVLPYFIKSENSQVYGEEGYHGKGGLWNAQYSLPPAELLQDFLKSNVELDVSVSDYNAWNHRCASELQFNIKAGQRQSAGRAFLSSARSRRNLKVVTRAFVTKVKIDPLNKVATGVEFISNNRKFQVVAKKEVILSGGAVNSPQLLMLSGIGPKAHLEDLGIEVLADLPVGQKMLEHPMFPAFFFRTNHTSAMFNNTELIELYLKGLGPLTRGAGASGISFIDTTNNSLGIPTIEYLYVPSGGNPVPILARSYNYNETLQNFMAQMNPATDNTILLVLLHEKSRGRLTLKSSNPVDFPNIDLNMLNEQEDVDTIVEGIEFALKLLKTEAFQAMNATLLEFPICTDFEKNSKSFWECIVRHMTITIFHVCGTTPMGPNYETSVVDTNLNVHGIRGLRVVDAGVFPSTISGHTNAPVIMVAEKIADVIKRHYSYD